MCRMHVKIMLLLLIGTLIACGGDGGEEGGAAAESTAADSADMTDSTLTVLSTFPPRGSMSVPRNVQISVNFSENVDPRTVTDSSFMLIVNDVTLPVAITWLENVVTLTPVSPLAPNTTYTVKVTTAVRDLEEKPLALDYIWSFTTSSALTQGSPGHIDGE